ncbi:hypothetical protein CPB85DRAFT_1348978 [Mucidula mucida]|nr:hypothetical protein CPB85DRAFT_1348978 [Mucidula mucida]
MSHFITDGTDTVVCLANKRELLDLVNRISTDSALQTSLQHLTLKEFSETRTQYFPGSGARFASNPDGLRSLCLFPSRPCRSFLQMLSAHASSLTNLTLDGLCGPNSASEETIDGLLSLGNLFGQLPRSYSQSPLVICWLWLQARPAVLEPEPGLAVTTA